MTINSTDTLACTKYTKNENPYLACNTGKRVGTIAGAGLATARAVYGIKSGAFKNIMNSSYQAFVHPGFTKLDDFIVKNPKLYKYGTVGFGIALGFGLLSGLGRLIGHGVDKIVENKRAKEADAQAEQLNYVA
jgi:hypothetical protein